jgi:hypothetical protein
LQELQGEGPGGDGWRDDDRERKRFDRLCDALLKQLEDSTIDGVTPA